MVKCKKCSRISYLNQDYCKEHYTKLYKLPVEIPKYKERQWRDFLQYHLLANWCLRLDYDKQLEGTSVKPDIFFFFLGTLFIVEVDEFQHRQLAYEKERDDRRYEQLKLYRHCIILRVNTDGNKEREGVFKRVEKVDPESGDIVREMEVNEGEFSFRKACLVDLLDSLLLKEAESYPPQTSPFFSSYTSKLEIYKLFYD